MASSMVVVGGWGLLFVVGRYKLVCIQTKTTNNNYAHQTVAVGPGDQMVKLSGAQQI